jgi:hypothetical protein
VTGLTNGQSYAFTVSAINAAGTGPASASSNSVTPQPPPDPVVVTSVGPNLGTGASWREVYVQGSGFTPGTTASLGEGVTVHQTVLTSPTTLTLRISIDESAAVGPRTAAVVGGNGVAGSCVGCFQVLPPPVITSVTPNAWLPGSTQEVQVAGVFNPWGVTVNVQGTGVTVSNVQITTTLLRATVTVASNAAPGERLMGVRNGDQGITRVPVTIGAAPLEVPQAPTQVAATPGNAQASVQFTPPSSGALPESYIVRAVNLSGGVGGQTATGFASPIVVTGLTNGDRYAFTVSAVNAAGDSVPSAPSAGVVPTAPANTAGITSVTPALGPGASNREIYVNGTGFVPGSTVTISGGVVVHGVVSTTSTRIAIRVSIPETQTAGPRNVSVTAPDGTTSTCTGCYSVAPPPVIGGVTPSTWARSSSQTVDIAGSSFLSWGVTVSVSGTGVTVSGVTRISASLVRATVTVASDAGAGARTLTLRNGDQGLARFNVAVS